MNWTDRLRHVKIALVAAAVLIVAGSLFVSYSLTRDLQAEEQRNVGVWAEAMRAMSQADSNTDLALVLKVLESNHTIPVVVLDERDEVLESRNVNLSRQEIRDSLHNVKLRALEMKRSGHVIRIELTRSDSSSLGSLQVCYGESVMLQRLARYP